MIETFLTFCSNLWIIFINAFVLSKSFIFGFPYVRFAIIGVTAFCIYKMSQFEYEQIKDPYMKAGRRRI